MRSPLARAIRDARLSLRLTQDQLGMRLGLKGRAVYRWERGASAPTRRHRRALVTAVQAIDANLAAKLQAELTSHVNNAKGIVVAPAAPPAPAEPTGPVALELAIFAMADELDLTPRRLHFAVEAARAAGRGGLLTGGCAAAGGRVDREHAGGEPCMTGPLWGDTCVEVRGVSVYSAALIHKY